MKYARFWTGLVFCAGLPISLVMGITAGATRYSQVVGSVTYHGRPVTEAVVLFQSLDRRRTPDIVAIIDRSGHFEGRAEWSLDPPGRTQFRLHVLPDPRDARVAQLARAGPEPPPPAAVPRSSESVPHQDLPPTDRAALALRNSRSSAAISGASAKPAASPALIPSRWLPEIWLAPEPTRIDIDLKD